MNPLFGDAEPDAIVRTITTDWRKFAAVAYIVLGERKKWEAAVQEFDLLQQIFYRDQRDLEALVPVFELLIERAYQSNERLERIQFMSDVLEWEMPGLQYEKWRATALDKARRENQITRRDRENKEWLRNYLASRR